MKQLLSVVLLLIISVASRSQSNDDEVLAKEFGVSLGAMNCNTDIGGLAIDLAGFKPSVGLFYALSYDHKIGARLEATLGAVTATDKRAIDYDLRGRNLDFTSSIKEVSLLTEVHPFNLFSNNGNTTLLSPYLLAGVGYFAYNPRTELNNGQSVYLHPLHTEGQGFEETGKPNYQLSQFNYPVGGGLQYNFSDAISLRGEVVYRFLKTDYLDDVSTTYIDPNLFDKYLTPANAVLAKTVADRSYVIAENGVQPAGAIRGNPAKKDAFYSINIKLGIRLVKGSGKLYSSNNVAKKKSGCPSFRNL